MAKQPLVRKMRDYFVYDPALKELGTVPVVTRGDARVVVMTKEQAAYWLDHLVIGEKPLGDVSDEHRDMMHQVSHGRINRDDDKLAESAPETKSKQQGPRGRGRVEDEKAALRGAARSGFSPPTDQAKRKDLEER